MSIFKRIHLVFLCVLLLSSFSAQQTNTSIEVFYYENSKGAYTLPYTSIVHQHQKKCIITNVRTVAKICTEIAKMDRLIDLDETELRSCDYVIRYKDKNQEIKLIGFDKLRQVIHVENKSYVAPNRLLKIVKRSCFGHWS